MGVLVLVVEPIVLFLVHLLREEEAEPLEFTSLRETKRRAYEKSLLFERAFDKAESRTALLFFLFSNKVKSALLVNESLIMLARFLQSILFFVWVPCWFRTQPPNGRWAALPARDKRDARVGHGSF